MFRVATAVLVLAVALAGPSAGAEKKIAPKLTKEARDGAQITQENIIKLKLKRPQLVQPNNSLSPSLGGPPPSPPPSLPNP